MRFNPGGDLNFQLDNILNGNIDFDDNIRGAFLETTLEVGEQELQHNLGYTPSGFILLSKEGQGDLWVTRLSDWNSQSLWLECNVTNLKVRLFVM